MEKKRWYLISLMAMIWVFLFFSGMVFAAGKTETAKKNYSFRLATPTNESHPIHQGAVSFKKLVEEKTKGAVKVEIFPNNTLGSAPQYTEQIALGAVDMGMCTSGQLQVYVKENAMVMAPFLFDDYDHAHRTLDGPAGKILADLSEKKGFVILGDWEWGFRAMTNNKRPINTPEDIKGLKMRVPPEMQLLELYKALGATTITIAFGELYMALSAGVVDGQCNPVNTIFDQKFYEVQKYMAITNHSYNSQMLTMSKKIYDPLSEDLKDLLKKAAQEVAPMVRKLNLESEGKTINELKTKGMQVTYPDLAPFRAAVKPAYEPIANLAGQKFANDFMRYVEEARSKK